MVASSEVLAFRCQDDDLAVLTRTAGARGSVLRTVDSRVEVAHQVVSRPAVAVLLGVGARTLDHLEVIPVIRAVRRDLPVIVIAEKDSLAVERAARQSGIFYYLVHPVDAQEVEALMEDLLRYRKG